jgi:hypothetical protein
LLANAARASVESKAPGSMKSYAREKTTPLKDFAVVPQHGSGLNGSLQNRTRLCGRMERLSFSSRQSLHMCRKTASNAASLYCKPLFGLMNRQA